MTKKNLIIIISSIVAILVVAVAVALIITNKNVEYTVIFNSDGGTAIDNQIVKKGDKINKPNDPTKIGYKFISWTYKNETYDFSLEVNSDMELKAKWYKIKEEIKEYMIKFNTNGGTTIPNQIVEEGKKVSKPKEPLKEGYIFNGWYLNDTEYDFDAGVNDDIELEAKWEKITSPTVNNNTNKPEIIKVETPTLSDGQGTTTEHNLTIYLDGYYSKEETINDLAGWELYEKNGNGYNLIEGHKVTVDIGETKTYVARAYKLNSSNQKVYSNYSNEVIIDNSKVETPTLSDGQGTTTEHNLTIYLDGYYSKEETINDLAGWELYEKNGNGYNLIEGHKVTVDIGETKTYVARAYKLNSSNQKVYSNYSNEVIIDNK